MTPLAPEQAWPPLPLPDWRATCDTLHLWMQIVGKVRLALSPHLNHWWEVPFYVSARGLTTSPMPCGDGVLEAEFDFIAHRLALRKSSGETASLELSPRPVADFYFEFFETLRRLGVRVNIWPVPVEIPHPIRFDLDRRHRSYDPEQAHRFWRALLTADGILKEFRAGFIGKDSPVHFFWGTFDLAATRYSGRTAPPRPDADRITRESYSHEEISAGWWPGDDNVPQAAFYCYAAPEPAGFRRATVRPATAFYNEGLGEFLLMYDDARLAPDPRAAVLDFLQSTYEAGAALGGWDRSALERPRGWASAAPAL